MQRHKNKYNMTEIKPFSLQWYSYQICDLEYLYCIGYFSLYISISHVIICDYMSQIFKAFNICQLYSNRKAHWHHFRPITRRCDFLIIWQWLTLWGYPMWLNIREDMLQSCLFYLYSIIHTCKRMYKDPNHDLCSTVQKLYDVMRQKARNWQPS